MNQADILTRLEHLLVEAIPSAVKKLRIKEPVYSLRVWYFGTDTDGDRSPRLMLTTEALGQKIIQDRGELAPQYIWCADELEHNVGVYRCSLTAPVVSELCKAWYTCLESLGALPPGPAELQPFRQMVQRVARQLNQLDWAACLHPTPDFIVFAADGSHDFCNDFEEMQASVPESQINALREKGLLGTQVWWKLE